MMLVLANLIRKKNPKHLYCIYTEMSEAPIAIRDIC